MRNGFYVYVFVWADPPTSNNIPGIVNYTSIRVAIIGGMAGLMILITCYIICKYITFEIYIRN